MNIRPVNTITQKRERLLWLMLASLVALALLPINPYHLLPGMLPPALHEYADSRAWFGLSNAMDVLSNLPFAVFGLIGLWNVRRKSGQLNQQLRVLAQCFYGGLVVTAIGSSYFHLNPLSAIGLAGDRMGMTVVFAGILGLAAWERISERAGFALMNAMLAGGAIAVAVWLGSNNIWPWAQVQFGGMAMLGVLAAMAHRTKDVQINMLALIGCYAAAKLFEMNDQSVYEATQHLISGHSLKHIVAGIAAVCVTLPGLQTDAPQKVHARSA